MNNNQQNPFKNLNYKMPPGMMQQKKTQGYIKLLMIILLGIFPLLICSVFITSTGSQEFNQWGDTGYQVKNYTWTIDYGFMWLLGIAIFIFSLVINKILADKIKTINLDTLPLVSSASLAMLNLFVIPHSKQIFLILSLPSFAIIGYILGVIIVIFITITQLRKQMMQMENDPEMKNAMNQFQNMFKGPNSGKLNDHKKHNNTKNSSNSNKNNKDYKNNPFVDVKDEEEEDKE
ncbi:MAG: hypothetical protein TYPL_3750 [Candidatus Tyloplasma litorale]|nr:MAG: hypothetical protein TYPL_3750 [Mycoplasmatales bacterium]